jgi:ferredoxin
MKIIINHKICDQSPACGGIEVCPTGALYWNEDNKKIAFDDAKCIGCGACENMCPIRAIHLARDAMSEKQINDEIADDPRRSEDLFVDRFGGDFVDTPETLSIDAMQIITETPGLTILELNNEDSIQCLLNCIPIADIMGTDVEYSHIKVMNPDEKLLVDIGISELPALVVFRDGVQIGEITGFFENNSDAEQNLIKSKMQKIIKG